MRKLTYYIATSLDGFVCRPDGRIDEFSFDGEHVPDLLAEYPETIPTHLRPHIDVSHDLRHFDTVLMGRRTYEVGLDAGFPSPYQHLEQYVCSSSLQVPAETGIHQVADNPTRTVQELKQREGLDIWLCGGPSLASSLVDEIDELIIKINPFLMGAGKTLFADTFPKREVSLIDRRDYTNGFSLVHYAMDD